MTSETGWTDRFPGLSRLPDQTRTLLHDCGSILRFQENDLLFGPGHSPQHMLFLLSGRVRVQQVSETGHEIVLYRIVAGQSCVLTTACLFAYEDYSAEGIAESDVKAVAIPRDVFNTLLAQSPGFRDFVLAAFSKRITDLFQIVDEVAFQRLDVRLAETLLNLAADARER